MQAAIGDHLIVHGNKVGDSDRRGEVLDVRGVDGRPPYIVRWDSDGHEGMFFPGGDVKVEAAAKTKPAKSKTTKGKKKN